LPLTTPAFTVGLRRDAATFSSVQGARTRC
jgi:hypothetical protein